MRLCYVYTTTKNKIRIIRMDELWSMDGSVSPVAEFAMRKIVHTTLASCMYLHGTRSHSNHVRGLRMLVFPCENTITTILISNHVIRKETLAPFASLCFTFQHSSLLLKVKWKVSIPDSDA